MTRYFLEIAYLGSGFSGLQIQKNANTIQGEINRAFHTLLKEDVSTCVSSRTDAGVHANQNFLHFDRATPLPKDFQYHLNAILPRSISISQISEVKPDAHARFSALNRTYQYQLCTHKNPFLTDRSYFYPFPTDWDKIFQATEIIKSTTNFKSFSKRHTQVKTFNCVIRSAGWKIKPTTFFFKITANRFLRGMVRGLVATLLKVGREKISVQDLVTIINKQQPGLADFSAPAHGLFLERVAYPPDIFLS